MKTVLARDQKRPILTHPLTTIMDWVNKTLVGLL